MRTTITLDENLHAELKRRAAQHGTTVSRLVEEAVRSALSPSLEKKEKGFELVTYGGTGRYTEHDLDKTSRLIEQDDISRYPGR